MIERQTHVHRSARVQQLEGIFDVEAREMSRFTLDIDFEEKMLPEAWNVGLIVGPSGSGKTTIAETLFAEHIVTSFEWHKERSILDAFPESMSIKEITMLLSSVGFSSPPSWVRPFHVLSNGEQFRTTLARALATDDERIVIDEFTSVVDRTVAKTAASAASKTVRRLGKQLIALSCHYDITEWLAPDWVLDLHSGTLRRDRLRRPDIRLTIRRVHRSAWRLFSKHHYLDTSIHQSAQCYLATFENEPVAFCAVIAFPHKHSPGWRIHRTVCLPDYQGVGIGNALNEYVAAIYAATGKPVFITTSHPAMIYSFAKSKTWHMHRRPTRTARPGTTAKVTGTAPNRLTAGFVFRGKAAREDAHNFQITGVL